MDVESLRQNLPILIVALFTWFGVIAYMVRLEKLTRNLEKQADSAREPREDS